MTNSLRIGCLLALSACTRTATEAPHQLKAELVIRDATLVSPGSDIPPGPVH